MNRIVIGIIGILLIAGVAAGGYFGWQYVNAQKTPLGETIVQIDEKGLGEIPENTDAATGEVLPDASGSKTTAEAVKPDAAQPDTNTSEGASSPEAVKTEKPLIDEPAILNPEPPIETSPPPGKQGTTATREVAPPSTEPPTVGAQPVTSPRPEKNVNIAVTTTAPETEATPIAGPETSETTADASAPTPIPTTPVITPIPSPVAGNYSVRTLTPVLESQLSAIRNAMNPLNVRLTEQKAGQQQMPAYRLAVGYFQTQQDAQGWAENNFRPRGVKYYVYPTQGMYSIQVGIFTQQQNVELAMRDLYQKYQGGRLPLRTEMATLTQTAYYLSMNGITEKLARKVQDTLIRMGVQAELTGI